MNYWRDINQNQNSHKDLLHLKQIDYVFKVVRSKVQQVIRIQKRKCCNGRSTHFDCGGL